MRSRAQIKAELEVELSSLSPDLDRVAELSAELKRARGLRARLRRERDVRDMQTPGSVRAEKDPDPDAEALATWPAELRARLHRAATARVLDLRVLDDPGGWGTKNDLRHGR